MYGNIQGYDNIVIILYPDDQLHRSHLMWYGCGYTAWWSSCDGTLLLQQELLHNAEAADYPHCTCAATPTCSSHII